MLLVYGTLGFVHAAPGAPAARAGAVCCCAAAVLEEAPDHVPAGGPQQPRDIRLMSTGPVIAIAGAVAAVAHVPWLHGAPRVSRGRSRVVRPVENGGTGLTEPQVDVGPAV
jgi:hypothetical protein